MEDTRTASQLLFDARQLADQNQRQADGRDAVRRFGLVLLLVTLTLAAATAVAHWGPDGIR